jgi:hypothetical protein
VTRRHSRELRAFNAALRRLEEHMLSLVLRGPVETLTAQQAHQMRQLLRPVLYPELERQP